MRPDHRRRLPNEDAYGPIVALVSEGFLSRLSFGIIGFALPLYAAALGMGLPAIGVLASVNVIVSIGGRPVAGWLADRAGLRRVFAVGILGRSLVALLLALAAAPWQLFAVRAILGAAQSLRDSSVNVLLAEYGGERRVASAFAWSATAKSLAGSIGGAVAGVALTASGGSFPLVFLVAFGISTLPLVIVLRFVSEPAAAFSEGAAGEAVTAAAHGKVNGDWGAIFSMASLGFLVFGTAQMLRGLLPVLATQYAGMSMAEAGIVYLASGVVVLVSGPVFGWLADTLSQRLVFAVRNIATIASSLTFFALPNAAGVWLGSTLDDVGKSAYRPAYGALMARVARFDRARRGQAMGVMTAGEDAGEIVGPILAGFVWGLWGVPAVLAVRVLLAVAGELHARALIRSLEVPPAPEHDRIPERLGAWVRYGGDAVLPRNVRTATIAAAYRDVES